MLLSSPFICLKIFAPLSFPHVLCTTLFVSFLFEWLWMYRKMQLPKVCLGTNAEILYCITVLYF